MHNNRVNLLRWLHIHIPQLTSVIGLGLFNFPPFDRFWQVDGRLPSTSYAGHLAPQFVVAQFIARSYASCRRHLLSVIQITLNPACPPSLGTDDLSGAQTDPRRLARPIAPEGRQVDNFSFWRGTNDYSFYRIGDSEMSTRSSFGFRLLLFRNRDIICPKQ